MKNRNRRSKPPLAGARGTTAASIAEWLREQILEGTFAPGSRLATRVQLEKTLGASSVTIQRAIDLLRDTGFLESRGTAGTFVTTRPPHLFRVGLVLPRLQSLNSPATLFWDAIKLEGEQLSRRMKGFDLVTYRDVDPADPATCQLLFNDIAIRRLAGVILVHLKHDRFVGTPLTQQRSLACVATGSSGNRGVSTIQLADYTDLAIEQLRQRRARRVAIMLLGAPDEPATHERMLKWSKSAERAGLVASAEQCIALTFDSLGAARPIARLLMQQTPDQRPDALILADDHLIEPATRGIADANPRRLPLVLGHANFPVLPPSSVPVVRIGYDIGQMLRTAVDALEQQLAGHRKTVHHTLRARIDAV